MNGLDFEIGHGYHGFRSRLRDTEPSPLGWLRIILTLFVTFLIPLLTVSIVNLLMP